MMGVNEQFTIKPARTLGNSRVQPFVVVGGPNDQNAVIVFQAIKLVQKEGAVGVVDQTIQILKDQDAGRLCPGLPKDQGHGELLTRPTYWSPNVSN